MSSPSDLCSRCAKLDIGLLWSSSREKRELGSFADWDFHSCVFCEFLRELLPAHPGIRRQEHLPGSSEMGVDPISCYSPSYYLYSMKTEESSEKILRKLENRLIVLSTSKHGPPPKGVPYIAVHPPKPPFWLRQVQPMVDFDRVKKWLDLCFDLHSGGCGVRRGISIAKLRVINCTTGEVTEAKENESYVALSYVWGQDDPLRQSSSEFPQTIQDAITVTRNLGYKWLWVDKYCINQKDRLETQKQLQQMDAIYKNAVVTLIAAAETHAGYGLPGVSKHPRMPASSVTVRGRSLSAIRGVPDLSSDNCKWASRAWTFQEGLLSTRRLVFTDEQVYFECLGLYCSEMFDIPLQVWKKMHHGRQPFLHHRYRAAPHFRILGVFPLDGCGVHPCDIYSRINEYSKRSLTHSADILNGMLGIFRAFEQGRNSVCHLYGLPFHTEDSRTLPTFSESLRWTLEAPSERREGFPSWSWTGWYGEIKWPHEFTDPTSSGENQNPPEYLRDPKVDEREIRVAVELREGSIINWETFRTRYDEIRTFNKPSGIIRLEANTTPAVYLNNEGTSKVQIGLRGEDGRCITLLAELTTKHHFKPQDPLLAIHICQRASGKQGNDNSIVRSGGAVAVRQYVLIVRDVGKHWERVASGVHVLDPRISLERRRRWLRFG